MEVGKIAPLVITRLQLMDAGTSSTVSIVYFLMLLMELLILQVNILLINDYNYVILLISILPLQSIKGFILAKKFLKHAHDC